MRKIKVLFWYVFKPCSWYVLETDISKTYKSPLQHTLKMPSIHKEIKHFSRTLTEFKDFSRGLWKLITFSRLYETNYAIAIPNILVVFFSPEFNQRATDLVASYSVWLTPLMAMCIRALIVGTSGLDLWSVIIYILFKQLFPLSTQAVWTGITKHSSTTIRIFTNSLPEDVNMWDQKFWTLCSLSSGRLYTNSFSSSHSSRQACSSKLCLVRGAWKRYTMLVSLFSPKMRRSYLSLDHNMGFLRSAAPRRTGSSWKLENLLFKYSLADEISSDLMV